MYGLSGWVVIRLTNVACPDDVQSASALGMRVPFSHNLNLCLSPKLWKGDSTAHGLCSNSSLPGNFSELRLMVVLNKVAYRRWIDKVSSGKGQSDEHRVMDISTGRR